MSAQTYQASIPVNINKTTFILADLLATALLASLYISLPAGLLMLVVHLGVTLPATPIVFTLAGVITFPVLAAITLGIAFCFKRDSK